MIYNPPKGWLKIIKVFVIIKRKYVMIKVQARTLDGIFELI